MKKDKFMDAIDRFLGTVYAILVFLFLVIALAGLASCTKYRYIEVPEIHYRDSVQIKHIRDSLFVHDSVFVSQTARNDTIVKETYRLRYAYKDRFIHDTVAVLRRDTIPKIVYVDKVEKVCEMTRLQTLFCHVGFAVSFTLLCYIVGWLVRKWR